MITGLIGAQNGDTKVSIYLSFYQLAIVFYHLFPQRLNYSIFLTPSQFVSPVISPSFTSLHSIFLFLCVQSLRILLSIPLQSLSSHLISSHLFHSLLNTHTHSYSSPSSFYHQSFFTLHHHHHCHELSLI